MARSNLILLSSLDFDIWSFDEKGINAEAQYSKSEITINISKSGNNYTISVPETQVYNMGTNTLVPCSFNYTGSIPKVEYQK